MPVQRIAHSTSSRSSPLPKGYYKIPAALPPPFGVSELFDWSGIGPTSSSSSLLSSSSVSTFKRYQQRSQIPTSLSKWVKGQESAVLRGQAVAHDDTISINTSTTGSPNQARPLFSLSRSPTPAKPGNSEVQLQLQLPSPQPSPVRSKKGALVPKPPTLNSHSHSASRSAQHLPQAKPRQGGRIPATPPLVDRAEQGYSTESDGSEMQYVDASEERHQSLADQEEYESFESEDEVEDSRECENEVESESESESEDEYGQIGNRGGASIYIDNAAKEASYRKRPVPKDTVSTRAKDVQPKGAAQPEQSVSWTGGAYGPMPFRKRPKGIKVLAPATWSFSGDGAGRQPVKNREVGDIHFSPAFSGNSGFDYWVCVDHPKRRWAMCVPGQGHPALEDYVLSVHEGNRPPQWILGQSHRANKSRARQRSV